MRSTGLRSTGLRSTGWLWMAVACAVLLPGSQAWADYYWAVAVGVKRFISAGDKDYRAERDAIGQCIAEFDPALCELTGVRNVGGEWEAEVAGSRGFFGADREQQSRADRSALNACRSQGGVTDCRIARRGQDSGARQPAEPERGRERRGGPRLEDLFER